MAKRQAKTAVQNQYDKFSAPPDADLYYIPTALRFAAVRIDSLVLDDENVKDHGETDLPTHQKSLEDFGIRRMVVVRTANRKVLAGNGTCMASLRNGWEYVPALFCDDTLSKAKAFALADNAIATLADWNEDRLRTLTAESLEYAGSLDLDALIGSVMKDLGTSVAEESPAEVTEQPVASGPEVKPEDINISRRFTVICPDEATQLQLMAEMESKGLECLLANKRIR